MSIVDLLKDPTKLSLVLYTVRKVSMSTQRPIDVGLVHEVANVLLGEDEWTLVQLPDGTPARIKNNNGVISTKEEKCECVEWFTSLALDSNVDTDCILNARVSDVFKV